MLFHAILLFYIQYFIPTNWSPICSGFSRRPINAHHHIWFQSARSISYDPTPRFPHPNSNGLKPTNSTFLASSRLSIHLPCYCTVHVYVVVYFCEWLVFWSEANLCTILIICVYTCIYIAVIKRVYVKTSTIILFFSHIMVK